MARNNYTIFNLNGEVQYFDKVENGYPVVEVHEFCCNSKERTSYRPDVIAEGHIYDEYTQAPTTTVRNLSFYCDQHHPQNFEVK